mgnify:CR=1 FL=1
MPSQKLGMDRPDRPSTVAPWSHTLPRLTAEITPAGRLIKSAINIDSSAAYGGPLTAIVLEGRSAFILGDQGRVPLTP